MILLISMGVFAVIGCIIGAVKGFTKVKSGGAEYVIAAPLTMLIGSAVAKVESNVATAVIVIASALALTVLTVSLFAILRAVVAKSIEKCKKFSYYQHYDEMHENDEKLADAVASKDKARYNKLSGRKFKQSGGAGAVANRVIGAVIAAVNGAVAAAVIGLFALTVLDLSQLGLAEELGTYFYGSVWDAFKPRVFDFMIIGFMALAVKTGFRSGITNTLWSLVVIGMVVFAGYIAYNLAFNVAAFNGTAENLAAILIENVGDMLAPEMADTLARVILTAALFAVMLVVVVLVSIFVPRFINLARGGSVFYVIDGILGAFFAFALVTGLFLVVGSLVQSFAEFEFMDIFNSYFEKSGVAVYFYGRNPIGALIK